MFMKHLLWARDSVRCQGVESFFFTLTSCVTLEKVNEKLSSAALPEETYNLVRHAYINSSVITSSHWLKWI